MNVLNTKQVRDILEGSPETEFSLQPVKVSIDGGGHIIAGYHIFEGQLPRMIHVKGEEIWNLVPHPGPNA